MSELFDPGLQPERTELAWRRTSLAMAVGSLVAMRLLPSFFANAAWALVGVGGLLAAAALWISARRRNEETLKSLREVGDRAALPGAFVLATTAAVVSGVAALAFTSLLVAVLR